MLEGPFDETEVETAPTGEQATGEEGEEEIETKTEEEEKTEEVEPEAKEEEEVKPDPEKPTEEEDTGPAGLEKQPKWVQKRIQKQSEDIRDLRAKLAVEAVRVKVKGDPLSAVLTMAELQAEVTKAQGEHAEALETQKALEKIREDDFVLNDRTGEYEVEVKEGAGRRILTKAEVTDLLTKAEAKASKAAAKLDPQAIHNRQSFIAARAEAKPWEAAETVFPGIMKEGTTANQMMASILHAAPQIRTTVARFEELFAHAARSLQQDIDAAPTKDFPKGRAKWVRLELDAKGAVIPPKQAATTTLIKPKTQTLTAPGQARPGTVKPNAKPVSAAWQRGKEVDLESWLDEGDDE